MTFSSIPQNFTDISKQLRAAAIDSGRNANDVTLIGVSKKHPAQAIQVAYGCGLRHVGENYLSEALEKQEQLVGLPITWHFIGPVQSNKTAAIAAHFSWVHSVDRIKVANRLNAQRPDDLPPLNVCLQVNLSAEATKSGVLPSEVADLAQAVSQLPKLTLRGLMAIPAPCGDAQKQREPFAALRHLLEALRRDISSLDTLSMGMSADMNAAVAEGATFVRIGTALFGQR